MVTKEKSGFIVHPFETGDRKFSASFGNHNKTQKSFKTLSAARGYLKKKGIKQATYDSPSGTRTVKINSTTKTPVKRRTVRRSTNLLGGFRL